ncbi:MAG: hypothetical protein GWO86_02340, partial [Planctomycetes bacterium]|nr:hypothetical protein [Planctomycetota bacterium]
SSGQSSARGLSSGPEARTFYEIARELYKKPGSGAAEAEQAMVLLNATLGLDERADYILPEVINISWLYPEHNYTDAVYLALDHYVDASCDLELPIKAVQYLLERLNSREEREALLTKLLTRLGRKNSYFSCDLSTQLGLLMAEKSDSNSTTYYLMQAYNSNPFSKLTFAKLLELVGQSQDRVVILIQLRNMMILNPLDLEAAMSFARAAEDLMLHSVSAAGYRYCADLFAYLYPNMPLPRSLYLPWLQSCYNMRGNQIQFREVIDRVRRQGGFDILAEAIAAKSALKIADTIAADNIFRRIDAEAHAVASTTDTSPGEWDRFAELAWYYSLIKPDEQKALTWATKAYEAEPNSLNVASIFAYALKINDQDALAEPIAEQMQKQNQMAAITKALIVGGDDAGSAIEILKSAIDIEPASLEAAYAKTLLLKYGSEYIEPYDLAALTTMLEVKFGIPVVAEFLSPEKIISTKLSAGNVVFSYGRTIAVDIIITNTSSQPLVISDEGLFTGNIRMDARITGDMKVNMPRLIFKKIRPSQPIKAGNAISVPLEIMPGQFGKLLNEHPQARLKIELTAYLDPVADANGNISSGIDIAPAKLAFQRRKLSLDLIYIQQKLDAISTGHYGQKVKSAKLFANLLAEQQSMAESGPLYRLIYAEPVLFKSALARIMDESEWNIKLQTMAALLPLKLDYGLVEAVSEQLSNKNWPVRLMAVFTLAKSQQQNFQQVIDWTAEHDENQIVRDMAVALGAVSPDEPE